MVGIKSNVWTYLPTPEALEEAIAKRLIASGVEEANMVFGAYDVCFSVKKENMEQFRQILNENLPMIKDVKTTLTLIKAQPEQLNNSNL